MNQIVIYSTRWCGYCTGAKALLARKGIPFTEVDLSDAADFRRQVLELTGGQTVPQIIIDGTPVGGYRELRALDAAGLLDELRRATSDEADRGAGPDAAETRRLSLTA